MRNELVFIQENQALTTAKLCADAFGKRHCDVIRAIENLDIPEDFRLRNFAYSKFSAKNRNGLSFETYNLTRDGFTLLAMGFTGKRALQFKLAYIEAFNKMEQALQKASLPSDRSRIVQPVDLAAIGLIVKRYTDRASELGLAYDIDPMLGKAETIIVKDPARNMICSCE